MNRGLIITGLMISAAASFIAMQPSLENDFTNWDDQYYVWENRTIDSLDASHLKQIFTGRVLGHYHPLTMLSLAMDYHWGKFKPGVYHLTSVVLHVLCTMLVWYLFFLISGNGTVAFITAVLFGVHPMHVEAVAWVSARKEVLYSLFYLGALAAYVGFSRGQRWLLYGVSLFLFCLSLLSKASAVSLPVLMLAWDYCFGKPGRREIITKAPFFAVAVIAGAMAFSGQKEAGAVQGAVIFTAIDRIFISAHNFFHYGYKAIVPAGLSAFYPYPGEGGLPVEYYLALPAAALTAYGLYRARHRRKLVFGTLFYLITIGLFLQLIPVGDTVMSDRYTYLPYAGLFYLVAAGFARLSPGFRPMGGLLLAGAVFILIMISRQRTEVWRDSGTLWTDVIEKFPNVSTAYNNRSKVYIEQEKFGLAILDYDQAIRLNPGNADAYNNRGNAYRALGNNEQAVKDFTAAIRLRPQNPGAFSNRSYAYYQLNKLIEARVDAERAIELGMQMDREYVEWLRANVKMEQVE